MERLRDLGTGPTLFSNAKPGALARLALCCEMRRKGAVR